MLSLYASRFPPFVADVLARGRRSARPFPDSFVSDLLAGGLLLAGGARVMVEFPEAPSTAADMEWSFVDPDAGSHFRLLLQWMTPGASVGPLCAAARALPATLPLCLYERAAEGAAADGFSLADGFLVEALEKEAPLSRPAGSAPLLFPLAALFAPQTFQCPSPAVLARATLIYPAFAARVGEETVIGLPVPPTPAEVRSRLVSLRGAHGATAAHPVPEVSRTLPADIRATLAGPRPPEAPVAGLARWRVTFIAGKPRETDSDFVRKKY